MAFEFQDDGSYWVYFFDYSYRYMCRCLRREFIPFIEGDRAYIDEAYLIQGHTLKKGPNDSLIFFYLGFTNEILLPNAGTERQHTRDAEPTHRQYPSMAASHWRKNPRHGAVAVAATGGVKGLLPLDGFQPRPAVVSLKITCIISLYCFHNFAWNP